jgi:ribonuclease HI
MTIEPPCIETCWSGVRATRVVAVAVQPADGDDFAFHAVEKYTDQEWSGTVKALSADAALLDVFVQIRCDIPFEDRLRFLVKVPSRSAVWTYQNEIRAALPQCTVQGPSRDDAELMVAAHSGLAAVEAVEPQPEDLTLPPLVVSADGSVRGRFSGNGWLASDGQYGLRGRIDTKAIIGPQSPLVAELRAIDDAVRRLTRRRLTVFCDNSHAVSMARKWMAGEDLLPRGYITERASGKTAGLVTASRRMYLNRERLDIRWIRSHQGEPLNEGADALARLASRYVKGDSELSAAAYRERAGGLAGAFAAEFRRRAAEAETVLLSA